MGGNHAGSSSSMNFTSTPSLVTRQPIRRASSTEETSDEEASLRCSYSKLLRLSWQVVKLSDVQLLAPPPPAARSAACCARRRRPVPKARTSLPHTSSAKPPLSSWTTYMGASSCTTRACNRVHPSL